VRTWAAVLVALVSPSCSVLALELGEDVPAEALQAFSEGRTRRAQVLERLGPPTLVAAHGDGCVLLYEHVLLDERQFGISFEKIGILLGMPWLSWIKLSLGNSGARHDVALLIFDREGVLRGRAAGEWREVFGKGASMQVLLAVDQVVDPGTIRDLPIPLHWGRELLLPLSTALNLSHRPDLEVRGTGNKAGQRTLELEPYATDR
jgi:hypothetical protein